MLCSTAVFDTASLLVSDFRSLAVTCLCRGEVAAPRVLIKQLAQQNGLNRILLSMYLAKCLEQGQPVNQLLQDIEPDVDLTQFPGVCEYVSATPYLLIPWGCVLVLCRFMTF